MTEACARTWRGAPLPSQRSIRTSAFINPVGCATEQESRHLPALRLQHFHIGLIQPLTADSQEKTLFGDDHHIRFLLSSAVLGDRCHWMEDRLQGCHVRPGVFQSIKVLFWGQKRVRRVAKIAHLQIGPPQFNVSG
jgi:hypothetical protein